MIKNKIFIICLVLCICFSIQTIYAEDVDSDAILNDDPTTVEFDGTTFSELQNEINRLNDNDTLILTNDISQDSDAAIEINKDIIITGKDITIDAQNRSNIFNINTNNVIINNITFINGNNDKGGAINSHCFLTISDCKFINNTAGGIYGEGGAIYSLIGKLTITGCVFESNSASAGGAIHSYVDEIYIETSRFIDNCAKWYGGAIYHDYILRIKSSSFSNNNAYSGGAVHYTTTTNSWELGGDAIISDSNFSQNTACFGGATSTSSIARITYDNCNFTDNYATRGGVTYRNAISRNFFNNCLIESNSAEEGAVIYDDSKVNSFDHYSFFVITNSTLKYNHDLKNKASVFYARDCHITIDNTTIVRNSDNPIYNGKGNITVINSNISNNSGIFITQFYLGNITVINNTWDKKDPKIDEIINCTSNSTVIYSNSYLPVDLTQSSKAEEPKSRYREIDCCTTFIRISETESVISHRRDGGDNYNMTVYVDYQDDHVTEFKSTLAYFFLSKVYANGWMMGTGGWDSSAENEKIEAIGSDMVLNENINMESLQLILDTKQIAGAGHFLIVSPNGTYGNIITYAGIGDFIDMGILNDGDYIISPNGPEYRRQGHLNDIADPVYSNMNLSANDRYGYDRHCILVHHVIHEGEKFTDYVYGANDDGSYVDLDNSDLSDNYWFGEDYTRDSELPIILERKHLGTYSNAPIATEIDATNLTLYVSDAIKGFDYQIILNDGDDNPLAGKEVQFNFNGKNYFATTDSEGAASVELSVNKAGSYTVKASFAGDGDYSSIIRTAEIKVVKESAQFYGPKYITVDANEFTYRAALKTSAGKALANKRVTITFNGEKRHAYTDENGYLTLTLKANRARTYEIKLEFKGDALYEGITTCKYVKVAGQRKDIPISNQTDIIQNNIAKIINETIKLKHVNSTNNNSKENKPYINTITTDYSLAIYILAAVALCIIGIAIKRRNE